MKIEWKEYKAFDGSFFGTEYRGMEMVITQIGDRYEGTVYKGDNHISATPSTDLEIMKSKLIHIADAESNRFTGVWHPYPQDKPPKEGYYLITHKSKEVEIDSWSGEYWNYIASVDVIAWAELPRPYEGADT